MGSTATSEDIEFDEKHMPITTNLAAGLRRIRVEDEERFLWIGRIYINQKDQIERFKQVKIMGSIFGNALRVVMRLSEDIDQEAALAKRLIDVPPMFSLSDETFPRSGFQR